VPVTLSPLEDPQEDAVSLWWLDAARDSAGAVYVTSDFSVYRLGETPDWTTEAISDTACHFLAVAVDRVDNIYVSDILGKQVLKIAKPQAASSSHVASAARRPRRSGVTSIS